MTQKTALKLISLAIVAAIFLTALVGCASEQSDTVGASGTSTQTGAIDKLMQFSDIESKETFTLKYENSEFGRLEGELEQSVKSGGSGSTVKAVADDGYVFVGWSDGKLSEARRDVFVEGDITVSPIFKKVGTKFSITYVIKSGSRELFRRTKTDVVGKIVRMEVEQPEFAWEFIWSDGKSGTTRGDGALADGKTFVGTYQPRCYECPVICINTDDGEGITSKTEYKSGTVTLMNTSESFCFEDVSAQIRGRGNSSWGQPKKSYRIKFDEKRSMMGTAYAARNWTLIANFSDKTLSRNAIAYEFASMLPNIEFSSIYKFVELYLDGEYLGVYLLCDQIQTGNGRVDVDETLDGDSDTGYLIEVDNRATNEGVLGVDYFKAADGKTYTMKTPDTDDPNYDPKIYLTYIENYVNQCISIMETKDWNQICKYIDVNSFVDTYIVQELFCNLDCHSFSFFLYKEKGGKIYAGPVWDFDIGSGNNNYGLGTEQECKHDQDIINEGTLWVGSKNHWYKRLLKCDEFVALVRMKLIEYQSEFEQIIALTETNAENKTSYYAMYSQAMERNFERWDIMGKYIWPNPEVLVSKNNTLKLQLDYLNLWLYNRYRTVCEYYGVYPD